MQNRIEKYWQGEATRYNENIWAELNSFKKQAWKKLISAYLPRQEDLLVLDIGTGPGFFAMILAEMGHRVAGIDCAEKMLVQAKNNTQKAGLQVNFFKMDSHELAFPDACFDLLVCRNLTWILHDPPKAYREWYRVLKPVAGCLFLMQTGTCAYMMPGCRQCMRKI